MRCGHWEWQCSQQLEKIMTQKWSGNRTTLQKMPKFLSTVHMWANIDTSIRDASFVQRDRIVHLGGGQGYSKYMRNGRERVERGNILPKPKVENMAPILMSQKFFSYSWKLCSVNKVVRKQTSLLVTAVRSFLKGISVI